MENKKSYAELMKACAMTRKQSPDLSMTEIYIDMVLQEILFHHQREKLQQEIDLALDQRNHPNFLHYSTQFKELKLQYGM
ncbi:IDEAL domain-containing protein [Bacillus sp. 2205SS5-2]|uniref:IDEAL domain-containing protein n=1 Tax=Bacillus sp. 2205SS5-2 TaxID=3109031 RepID=UPI003003ADFD